MNKTNSSIDQEQARELYLFVINDGLFVINDGFLYKHVIQPAIRNFQNKIKRGVFNEDLAIQYFSNSFASSSLAKYKHEIDDLGHMNQATKNAFGIMMYDALNEQIHETNKTLNKGPH